MSAGQLARHRSTSSGTRPPARSATATPLNFRNPDLEFEPCAATASIFLFTQGASILCLHHDTLAIERRFEKHKEQILFLSVDNVSERGAGRLVVSYDAAQTAIVWDLFTGDEIARFASYEQILVAAWMKNGNVAFGNAQGNVILFEPSTSEHISARTIFDPITAIAPASDCQTYAIGYMNGSIFIAALQPSFTILHTLTTPRAPSPITKLAWHASSTKQKSDMLATQTSDGDLRVWSVAKPPTADTPKTIRILKRGDNMQPGLNWLAWSKNGRIVQYSEGETWAWDVRTKHITCEPIPTVEGVRALASHGPTATLFTLGPNHTVQQYDLGTPALVKSVQYYPMVVSTESIGSMQHQLQSAKVHEIPGAAPPMRVPNTLTPGRGPVTLSTIQRTTNEMQAIELARQNRSTMASPMSSTSKTESLSSLSSGGHFRQRTDRSTSSIAASGTTFSTMSPSLMGHESIFSGGSSAFPKSVSHASSGRRSKGSRLRQEVLLSPESQIVDLFPYTRARLSSVPYTHPQTLDQVNLSSDELRLRMLEIVFGWHGDIDPLIREELSHHQPGSTNAVLLSKWLGEVDVDMMAATIGSGAINSSDWMLLALSQMGAQSSTSKLGQAFVQRLLQQGDVHTSVTILLGLGNREDAVEVYVSRHFYMEAILLTCLVFPDEWQRQAHLVRRWGEYVVENSQQQLAIRCFSCTGVEPTMPWASPTAQSMPSSTQTTPNMAQVTSPPTSPPPAMKASAPSRMTAKTSSLKLITSFGAQEKGQFKFPGLKSDDRTPTVAPGVTPIAESAISPGGTPGGFLRPNSRSKNLRAATPGGYSRSRLPSIGETPIDVYPPPYHRPSALPTPNDSESDREKGRHSEPLAAGASSSAEDPPLLLSSARYDPETPVGKSPMTALPNTVMKDIVLPDPVQENFIAFREKALARNASRDRKPDGLHLQMPLGIDKSLRVDHRRSNTWSSLQANDNLSSRDELRNDAKSPPGTGQSWSSAKSPSVSGRSIDQYISSLDEANYRSRRHKGETKRHHRSREGRSGTGGKKARSKQRSRDPSEDRSRGNNVYIRPAKRSPSSPVPMSPEDLQLYRDSANMESVATQSSGVSSPVERRYRDDCGTQRKDVSKIRSGSKTSEYSQRTVRRISTEEYLDSRHGSGASCDPRSKTSSRQQSPEGLLDATGRGRSKSKKMGSVARSPSSPLPMSPQIKHSQGVDDEDDRMRLVEANRQRIRSTQRSTSRRPRERGTSVRRDASPNRRRAPNGMKSPKAEAAEEKPQSPMEQRRSLRRASGENPPSENSQPGLSRKKSDRTLKREMAARELEARRESLLQRPSAPSIPHPTDLARPYMGSRSQTDLGNSPTSWSNPTFPQPQSRRTPEMSISPESGVFINRAASVGPYGLPATPRAMKHPKYDFKGDASIPTVPEIPGNMQYISSTYYTGQPLWEPPRSMSAPVPEPQLPPLPADLPTHPAFHRALRPSAKRPNFSPLGDIGQHRRRPSVDVQSVIQPPVTTSIDETLHAIEPSVQVVSVQAPPLLPELQHLSMPPPPPPPPPPFYGNNAANHSASSGSGLGVINIAMDDLGTDGVIEVPAYPAPQQNGRPLDSEMRGSPPPTTGRSNSNHRRGRSENFSSKIKGITERMRSTSRGRNTKSPQPESSNTPSPYESVPPLYF